MIPAWFLELRHIHHVTKTILSMPMTMVFSEGEVYCRFEDAKNPRLFQSMKRKLKSFQEVKEFSGQSSWLDHSRVPYSYYEHSKRRLAYKRRQTLKEMFPRHRGLLKTARTCSQKRFLEVMSMCSEEKAENVSSFKREIRRHGFHDPIHLWRVCHNLKAEIPRVQRDLLGFLFD